MSAVHSPVFRFTPSFMVWYMLLLCLIFYVVFIVLFDFVLYLVSNVACASAFSIFDQSSIQRSFTHFDNISSSTSSLVPLVPNSGRFSSPLPNMILSLEIWNGKGVCPCSDLYFHGIHHYLKIVVPVDVLWFPEFRSMADDHSEIIMVNYSCRTVGLMFLMMLF